MECLFNQRCRHSSNASRSVYTFGSVCLVNVRLSWFLRSKEISVMCTSRIRSVSPFESASASYIHSKHVNSSALLTALRFPNGG